MADETGFVPNDGVGNWERVFVAAEAPKDRCGLTFDYGEGLLLPKSMTCWRKSWRTHRRCIWHADSEGKSTDDLAAARGTEPERLDGAMLRQTRLNDIARFDDCVLVGADFTESSLSRADLTNADLRESEVNDVDLREAELTHADLWEADLTDADLRWADLTDAGLYGADLTDANGIDTVFDNAGLENAILTRTDLREATLSGAALYQAQFSDIRINDATKFDDVCSYEATNERPSTSRRRDDESERAAAMRGATWVYRRLEAVHEANALADRTRHFHIRKEEAQRKLDREQGNYGRYAVSTLNKYLTNHGESIGKLLLAWAVTIVGAGLLYPFVGGVEDGGTRYYIPLTSDVPSVAELASAGDAILRGLYFSVITFTTIGYANVAPHGAGSRVLVGIESLVGAILIALFVYVLGRRVAR